MPAPVFRSGSTALITGAGSGIGFALAKFCAAQGMSLLLADKKISGLSGLHATFPAAKIISVPCDVSSPADWAALQKTAEAEFGSIELLALNAGSSVYGAQWDNVQAFRATFDTNVFGVVNGISAFLPAVKKAAEKKPTAIVITGSKQGITNPPGNMSYNASKAAVKSLAEQLSFDLQKESTSVHLLVPGWTFTKMVSLTKTHEAAIANKADRPERAPSRSPKVRGHRNRSSSTWTIR